MLLTEGSASPQRHDPSPAPIMAVIHFKIYYKAITVPLQYAGWYKIKCCSESLQRCNCFSLKVKQVTYYHNYFM